VCNAAFSSSFLRNYEECRHPVPGDLRAQLYVAFRIIEFDTLAAAARRGVQDREETPGIGRYNYNNLLIISLSKR